MNSGSDVRQIEAAAAAWDVRLRSHACTDEERAAFRAWRDADSRHREAFDRLQSALQALREAADHPQLRALRERAEVMTRRASIRRAFIRSTIAAGLATLVVTIAVSIRDHWTYASRGRIEALVADQVYVTGPRERRTLSLPDGSSVTLNAGTRLETLWLPHERRIHLLSGQALFRVSKDPARPFVVTVAERTVTAVGTAFDVRLDADKVQVTLVEGRVAVRGLRRAARQPTLELVPNQQLVAVDDEMPTIRAVDVAQSIGWAEGQVFFTDETLPAAVAEMNRYSAQQIVIGDSSLARYRVNGMFRSGNQDGFVGALTSYYSIDAHRDAVGRIVLLPRSQESSGH